MHHKKKLMLILVGNTLEYYDFLLFAHVGFLIIPHYFPNISSGQAHLLSLFLFGSSFVIRPIGGYIFGRISDRFGRRIALIQSMQWAIFPALGLATLPTYDRWGITATYLLVILRLCQGVSLGGEYTTAGTYLMETYHQRRGLISAILGASGTVGSLAGFGLAYLCAQKGVPEGLWRIGFLLGAMGGIVSYYLRRILLEHTMPRSLEQISAPSQRIHPIGLVFTIGIMISVVNWLPMTYTNYYVTKIAGLSMDIGMMSTLVALLGYVALLPVFGWLSDRFPPYHLFMKITTLCAIPLGFIGFLSIMSQYIVIGQICLVMAAASFGASLHVVMNQLFPKEMRGRYVSTFFTLGLSVGAIIPSLSGYVITKTGFHLFPAFAIALISFINFTMLQHLGKAKVKREYLDSHMPMQKRAEH